MDAPYPPQHAGGRRADRAAGRPERVGRVEGLLPALALQVRRRREPARSTSPASRRSSRSTTTAARAATSPATSTSTAHNNLWLVTGDDTPAGGGNSGGFAPFNDMKTNETQTVRVTNATGGTFTLTFDGQTTAPIAYNATAAQVQAALEALAERRPRRRRRRRGGPGQHGQRRRSTSAARLARRNVAQMTADGSGLTGTAPAAPTATTAQGGLYNPPWFDARRSALNTNDLRGKVLRIKVAADGSYTVPAGNLFPESEDADGKTRPEIYAMGFRNPFRIQVDENDVAYVTDYSPDSSVPGAFRGPAGTGRMEIVRKPANYGWPRLLPHRPAVLQVGLQHLDHAAASRSSAATRRAGPRTPRAGTPGRSGHAAAHQPGPLVLVPGRHLGHAVLRRLQPRHGAALPAAVPELGTGGVGPHGATKYHYDPDNPSTTKFPPYYDEAVFFGEFTRDYLKEIRLDSAGKVLKINSLLNCGAVGSAAAAVRVRQPDGPAVRGRRQLLPADLRRRLLRRQRGRRHVPLRLRQGPARAAGGAGRHAHRRAARR